MTLQDLGNIGELVSGIAVVFSLVYVAHQIRQNTHRPIKIPRRYVRPLAAED